MKFLPYLTCYVFGTSFGMITMNWARPPSQEWALLAGEGVCCAGYVMLLFVLASYRRADRRRASRRPIDPRDPSTYWAPGEREGR